MKGLAASDIEEYRLRIRSARIREPNAPDGTPGLTSLADRRGVHAALMQEVRLKAAMRDEGAMEWHDREQYASMLYRNGDVGTKEEGRKKFDVDVTVTGQATDTTDGRLRIGIPAVPRTVGYIERSFNKSLGVTANIASQGALDLARSRLNFTGMSLKDQRFSDVRGGSAFSSVSEGISGGATLGLRIPTGNGLPAH